MTSLQFQRLGTLDFFARRSLVRRVTAVNASVRCAHSHAEMARILKAIFDADPSGPGCLVEAGAFKGGSTTKLSIAASLTRRTLVVFDSFEGLPDHDEPHHPTTFGQPTRFVKGLYAGQLEEVSDNVRRYGEIDACEFVKGWFDETMPGFHEPVAIGFLDVDLATSTRTCLRYLYPLLVPGGVLFSHDGNLPLCIEVFKDEQMWAELGGPPIIEGLGIHKLISITKPQAGR